MKLVIDIPEDFEIDFKNDRFFECFSRIRTAASKDHTNIAGNYEYETFDMLLNAFDRAITVKELLQLCELSDLEEHFDKTIEQLKEQK